MLFNDPTFIFLFLPIVFLIYFLLHRLGVPTFSRIWLVLSSLFFYGYWNFSYLFLIIVSMVINFSVGLLFQRKGLHKKQKKYLLVLAILLNVGALSYFKYIDFLIGNVNIFFNSHLQLLHPILPLAISFYTFQQIAYLIDAYQEGAREYSFLNYCLFITFFPHMIAGPITHHKEMMPQFADNRSMLINYNSITLGLFVFSIGLFKKVYIADSFAVWANYGFNGEHVLTFLDAWMTSLSYTFQLYYDFSGYSDMALGCALLFNIHLPINFNSPYKAQNIQDFWRRWHMTLSRWLRDYIYIPLGGNRRGALHTYFNIFLTFLLGGMWHGANWTFIIWGSMHGTALLVHRLWQALGLKMPIVIGWLCTFIFINATWVVFRAENIGSAGNILKTMFWWTNDSAVGTNLFHIGWRNSGFVMSQLKQFFTEPNMMIHTLLFGVLTFLGINSMQLSGFINYSGSYKFNTNACFAICSAILVAVSIYFVLVISGESEFLYFNF